MKKKKALLRAWLRSIYLSLFFVGEHALLVFSFLVDISIINTNYVFVPFSVLAGKVTDELYWAGQSANL